VRLGKDVDGILKNIGQATDSKANVPESNGPRSRRTRRAEGGGVWELKKKWLGIKNAWVKKKAF